MRPEPGQVLHFSEDPAIKVFSPHVAKTAPESDPYVWAVSWHRAPDYWFPRQCPRAMVSEHAVSPLGPPERVGDLFALHEEAGIELRALPNLWAFWDAVAASTLDFSGIRLRNARPRPGSAR